MKRERACHIRKDYDHSFALAAHARQMRRDLKGHWMLESFDEPNGISIWRSDDDEQITLTADKVIEPKIASFYVDRDELRRDAEIISRNTGVDTETVITALMVWLEEAIAEIVRSAGHYTDRIASEHFSLPEPPDSWYDQPEDAHLEMEYEARTDPDCFL